MCQQDNDILINGNEIVLWIHVKGVDKIMPY